MAKTKVQITPIRPVNKDIESVWDMSEEEERIPNMMKIEPQP